MRNSILKSAASAVIRTVALGLAFSAFAEVKEIKSFTEAGTIDPGTLVVFDIDNTLLEPVQSLGSDQWGGLMQQRLKDQGVDPYQAVDQGVAMFAEVQLKTQVKLTEEVAAQFVRKLQARGLKVMALTARPMNLVDRSIEQLKGVGIDFSKSAPTISIPQSSDLSREVRFKNGVLFVGAHNSKGQVLNAALNGNLPQAIVFFDDKAHHVEDLESVFAHQTQYTGYRYGGVDGDVKSFDPAVGDFEWKVFKTWDRLLSDEKARDLMRDSDVPSRMTLGF